MSASLIATAKPNLLIIMADDMGYSDIGCFGSEIETPNLDHLAANGIRYTQMYNASKCDVSRSALLSGRYVNRLTPQANLGVGPTIGEVAQSAGYRTLWAGKNHNGIDPTERGFDRFMGIQGGGSNFFCPGPRTADGRPVAYTDIRKWMVDDEWVEPFIPTDPDFYTTDAFTDAALGWLREYQGEEKPFLLYMAYTAPHYPIQAPEEDIAKYRGRYDAGYQVIQQQRYERMIRAGVIDPEIAPLNPQTITEWSSLSAEEQKLEAMRMEIYAAMIDRMDQNIGRLIDELKRQGELENTLILFFSDNGAERARGDQYKKNYTSTGDEKMGSAFTWESIGRPWSLVANTPLGGHKKMSHEGGVCTPMVAHWPEGIDGQNLWYREPAHLVDIMSTVLDLSGASYLEQYNGKPSKPVEGVSLVPSFALKAMPTREKPIGYDYKFGQGLRLGDWKLVKFTDHPWELYDLSTDRTETKNLAKQYLEKVEAMQRAYSQWEAHCGEHL